MASPAPSDGFSQDFSLDAGILGPVKITLAGSTEASAAKAILANQDHHQTAVRENMVPASIGGNTLWIGRSICNLPVIVLPTSYISKIRKSAARRIDLGRARGSHWCMWKLRTFELSRRASSA